MATSKRILFIHPDLGIGGAERLVVDAAVGLQDRGHTVTIYTSHCDPRHCFDEARNGTLQIRVAGNTIVPPNIAGRFSILCAILRQLHLSSTLILSGELWRYDWIFIDQLSASIPLYKAVAPKIVVLFYCHFPDYLLAQRTSFIKSLYRIPFDWVEAFTTGMADSIVVNSRFTKSVFASAFPRVKSEPRVVYPCVDASQDNSPAKLEETELLPSDGRHIILSINRFERKKNIALAIKSFALLNDQERAQSRLVVAGGYDNRVAENIGYHRDLVSLCDTLRLTHVTCRNFITSLSIPEDTNVLFLLSIPASLKTSLLHSSSLLLYTPEREHFGIVPLEAMIAELPILAHKSGGPLETIQEDATGWLRPDKPSAWATVIRKALFQMTVEERKNMGKRGREIALAEFSREKMAERLEHEVGIAPRRSSGVGVVCLLVIGGLIGLATSIGIRLVT